MDKVCFACKETKPASEFYANPQKADGLSTYCKPCFIAKQRAYYKPHPRPTAPDGMKRCSRCQETLPIASFGSNKRNADGLSYVCKPCAVKTQTEYRERNPGKHSAYQREWAKKHRKYQQDSRLRWRVGLPLGSYDQMLEAQSGVCAICKQPPNGSRLHVDHCHDTSQVRGLLCSNCNTGLGQFKHDPDRLRSAINYLGLSPESG